MYAVKEPTMRANATTTTMPQGIAQCPACADMSVSLDRDKRLSCPQCGTIWMPTRRGYAYDDRYPADRGHHDPTIARCKQITLRSWLRRTHTPIAGKQVLEVGFGGGATLDWMQAQGAVVSGQEPVPANRSMAIAAGISPDRIKPELAEFHDQRFDLVLYLDSFEHLLDPEAHLRCLNALTAPGSRALVVLPVADSLSRRMLGRGWPHDIPDHWVFYSKHGLTRLWGRSGWRPVASFYPWKFVSLQTIARHAQMKTRFAIPLGKFPSSGIWLNFGERGLLFEKLPTAAAEAP